MNCKLTIIAIAVVVSIAYFSFTPATDFVAAANISTRSLGPAEIFTANCAKCHGADGRAKTAKGKRLHATDFTSDWNTDENRGIRIITNGKEDMPSFKKTLTAEEIRSVFHYVVSFKQ
jgi:mono/diheme cytochrome c family protein